MAEATQVQVGPRWGRVIAVALVMAVLLGAVVGLVLVRSTSSASASLTLEPSNTAGSDPFTDSIANAVNDPSTAAQAQFATTRSSFAKDGKTGALLASATAPGLYGGTGSTKTCNPDQLISFLAANPDKAKAWAAVFDITAADIPAYVASLTPIVLTSDTRVTNHGYKNGRATAYQAVLETGTAVMVDTNGIPRVKCNCGNPLTEPTTLSLTNATLNGIQWQTYTPDQVVIVQPNIQITTFVIVNIQTAATYNVTAPPPPQLGTGTATTSAATGDAITIEMLRNLKLPSGSCGGVAEEGTELQLRDGQVPQGAGIYGYISVPNAVVGDLDGDGRDDGVIDLQCSSGVRRGTFDSLIAYLAASPDAPIMIPLPDDPLPEGLNVNGPSSIDEVTIADGELKVRWTVYLDNASQTCCDSLGMETVYTVSSTGPTIKSTQTVAGN